MFLQTKGMQKYLRSDLEVEKKSAGSAGPWKSQCQVRPNQQFSYQPLNLTSNVFAASQSARM